MQYLLFSPLAADVHIASLVFLMHEVGTQQSCTNPPNLQSKWVGLASYPTTRHDLTTKDSCEVASPQYPAPRTVPIRGTDDHYPPKA